ncbi:MAG: hypothetical protein F6K58_05210 [Symploca sp. SIO2E9]|nr:hypothetical protein [Symploca sp. SIO2E9]
MEYGSSTFGFGKTRYLKRWGEGEMGRWGDGGRGRWGDGERGRWGDDFDSLLALFARKISLRNPRNVTEENKG